MSRQVSARRKVPDRVIISNDTSVRYKCEVQGINSKYRNFAEVTFPGKFYCHLSTVVVGDFKSLPLLPHDPKGNWIQEDVRRQLTSRCKPTFYHCAYCSMGFTVRGTAVRHAFGIGSDRHDCKERQHDEPDRQPFACSGLDTCPACISSYPIPVTAQNEYFKLVREEEEAESHQQDEDLPPLQRLSSQATSTQALNLSLRRSQSNGNADPANASHLPLPQPRVSRHTTIEFVPDRVPGANQVTAAGRGRVATRRVSTTGGSQPESEPVASTSRESVSSSADDQPSGRSHHPKRVRFSDADLVPPPPPPRSPAQSHDPVAVSMRLVHEHHAELESASASSGAGSADHTQEEQVRLPRRRTEPAGNCFLS